MDFRYAIVLTGGIATGKSSVADIFTRWGFVIIDADQIAHKILDTQYKEIASLFGAEVIENHKVNRKALGAIVFADKSKRQVLESLLHPLIYEAIVQASHIEEKKQKPYFVDIPLFFETKRYPMTHVMLVYCSRAQQFERLMQRDGYSYEEAKLRIEAQMDIEDKKIQSTYIINNTQTKQHLQGECAKMREVIVGDLNDSN